MEWGSCQIASRSEYFRVDLCRFHRLVLARHNSAYAQNNLFNIASWIRHQSRLLKSSYCCAENFSVIGDTPHIAGKPCRQGKPRNPRMLQARLTSQFPFLVYHSHLMFIRYRRPYFALRHYQLYPCAGFFNTVTQVLFSLFTFVSYRIAACKR